MISCCYAETIPVRPAIAKIDGEDSAEVRRRSARAGPLRGRKRAGGRPKENPAISCQILPNPAKSGQTMLVTARRVGEPHTSSQSVRGLCGAIKPNAIRAARASMRRLGELNPRPCKHNRSATSTALLPVARPLRHSAKPWMPKQLTPFVEQPARLSAAPIPS